MTRPPAWFRAWYPERSTDWVREEWARTVEEAEEWDVSPLADAWVRYLRRMCSDGDADEVYHRDRD